MDNHSLLRVNGAGRRNNPFTMPHRSREGVYHTGAGEKPGIQRGKVALC
jgi:hypothetical protein